MNDWDDELKSAFEQWCASQSEIWRGEGADIDEVRGDLTAQVNRWRAEAQGPFGKDELLERLGAGSASPQLLPDGAAVAQPTPAPAAQAGNWIVGCVKAIGRVLFGPGTTVFWGVILPVSVFLLEILLHWCGAVFFDPFPSLWHGLLVVIALTGSFLVWRKARIGVDAKPATQFAGGAAMAIGAWYSLLVLPIIAMAWGLWTTALFRKMGWEFAPTIPVLILGTMITAAPFSLVLALYHWRRFWWEPGRNAKAGLVAGLLALTVVEGPRLVARASLGGNNVALARAAASRGVLLLACYEGGGGTRSSTDTSGWIWSWLTNPLRFTSWVAGGAGSAGDARLFYYQVTGEAYNAVPQPRLHGFGTSREIRQTIDWDPDVGGNAVASRLSGIRLASSRLDGHVERASRLGYWEWTLVFKNTAPVEREARMQVLLPPGGVVSRLTLWVDGEAQEAAFGSAEATTAAYRSVAVAQRRDPVLVRWVGPDRNLVQCFPVLRNGGEMKIRLGIITKIPDSGVWELPRIIERNFRIDEEAENAVWVQGDATFTMKALDRGSTAGRWKSRKGNIPATLLAHDAGAVTVDFDAGEKPPAPVVWCRDPFASADRAILISEPLETGSEPEPVKKIVAVVDGSIGIARWQDALVDALGHLQKERPVATWFAGDVPVRFDTADDLAGAIFAGGRDSANALERAFEEAGEEPGALVVWFHGSQPVAFPENEALHQVLERRFHKSRFAAVGLESGGNRLLEKLAPSVTETRIPRARLDEKLERSLEKIVAPRPQTRSWRRAATAPESPEAVEAGDQLARWRAWEDLRSSLGKEEPPVAERQAHATRYQLVTPWSGAVVLERKEDYAAHGLEQIDPSTATKVPIVPEPGTILLVMMSAVVLNFRRRRKGIG